MNSVDKNCIYCLKPIDANLEESIHERCRANYKMDMDNQDEILKRLQNDCNVNLGTFIELDTTNKKALRTSFELPDQIPLSDAENQISCEIELDNITNYAKMVNIQGKTWVPHAHLILELILQFSRIEHLELNNLGDVGLVNADFSNLTALNMLIIEDTEFTTTPNNFQLHSSVITILLNNVSSAFIGMVIKGVSKDLRELSIQNSTMTILPNALTSITDLTELDIGYTQITTLPESFGALSKLTVLELDNNKLHELPESFWQLHNIEELDLSTNELTDCSAIHDLPKLRRINLSNNPISDISTLTTNRSLAEITADYTNITQLSKEFLLLRELKELSFQGQTIKKLPNLGLLKKLVTLKLGMYITLANLEVIKSMQFLETLHLTGPVLNIIPDQILTLANIKRIVLNIDMQNIPEALFHLKTIEYIGIIKEKYLMHVFIKNFPLMTDKEVYINEYFVKKYPSLQQKYSNLHSY